MPASFYSIADYSTAVKDIPIRFIGGYSARRRLHAGIRYVPMRSILIELGAGNFQDSMADSSTTVPGIPIQFAGGCWARRQPHAGIRYLPVASKLRISLSSMEGVCYAAWYLLDGWLLHNQKRYSNSVCGRLSGSTPVTCWYIVRLYTLNTHGVTLCSEGDTRRSYRGNSDIYKLAELAIE